MLIFGAKLRNHCLLIFWMIIAAVASAKYLYIVCTRDWTSLEVCYFTMQSLEIDHCFQDWISISYLLFYLVVFLIIFSLMKEVQTNSSAGYVHGPVIPANTTVVINQQIPLQPQPQPQPPGYYPPPQQPLHHPPPSQPPPYSQQAPYNTGYWTVSRPNTCITSHKVIFLLYRFQIGKFWTQETVIMFFFYNLTSDYLNYLYFLQ